MPGAMPKLLLALLILSLTILHSSPEISAATSSKIIDQYRNALKITPEDTNTRYLLGRFLVQHGDYAAGIEEFLKVYPEKKLEPEINYNLGFAYLKTAAYDKADQYFNTLLSIDANAARDYRLDYAFINLGTHYRELGKFERAIRCFNLALRLNAGNIKTYLMLALLHSNKGDNGAALKYLEQAREIDDKDEELIKFITSIHNRIGSDYIANNLNAKARTQFEKVLEVDSSDLYAIYYLGYLDYLEKDMESSAKRLGILTSLKMDDEDIKQGIRPLLFNIGAYYLQNERYEKAGQSMERVLAVFPGYTKARYYLGLAAMNMEDYDKAIAVFEKVVELEPSNAKAIKHLGRVYDKARVQHFEKGKEYYHAKKYKEALVELERSILISPDFAPAIKYRDVVLEAFEGIRKEAEEKLGVRTSALIKEAKTLLADGELLAAREKLLKVKEIDPLNSDADAILKLCLKRIDAQIEKNLDFARTQMNEGKYYRAIKAFRKVIFFKPEHSEALGGIRNAGQKMELQLEAMKRDGETHMSNESFRRANQVYSKMLEINPEDEVALSGQQLSRSKLDIYYDEYLGMGRDYKKLKQFTEALAYFKKALNLKPGDLPALDEIASVRQKMGSLKGIEKILKAALNAFSKDRLNEAISGFLNVLKLDPDNKDAKRGLKEARNSRREKVDSMLTRAYSLYKVGKYNNTVDLSIKILALDSEEEKAKRLLAKARKAIRNEANPLLAKGRKLFDDGFLDAAVILFRKALKTDPGNLVARRYLSKMDSKHVLKIVEREMKKSYLIGIDSYTHGKYKKALDAWNDVLDLDPEHEKALLNIAKAKRKLAATKGEKI